MCYSAHFYTVVKHVPSKSLTFGRPFIGACEFVLSDNKPGSAIEVCFYLRKEGEIAAEAAKVFGKDNSFPVSTYYELADAGTFKSS